MVLRGPQCFPFPTVLNRRNPPAMAVEKPSNDWVGLCPLTIIAKRSKRQCANEQCIEGVPVVVDANLSE